jgi:glutamate mutase epsilon subunit
VSSPEGHTKLSLRVILKKNKETVYLITARAATYGIITMVSVLRIKNNQYIFIDQRYKQAGLLKKECVSVEK